MESVEVWFWTVLVGIVLLLFIGGMVRFVL